MYAYDGFDRAFLRDRIDEFRGQVARRLSGDLTEEEFKPLRLMNGVYLQLHAYMLRVAIPYGVLSSDQLDRLARIAEVYDKGYGHFTTRQNIQYNWPKLVDIPDILEELAEVDMHAIQTSGNTIRNVTADHFAGAIADEIDDPRPWAELIRQWSTLHPEFSFLPRKFKIAVAAAPEDRAATRVHDIGLRMLEGPGGAPVFEVAVGGGQGRTPHIAKVIREDLPTGEILPYLEAILRVYNAHGRRDNKFKARIKILVDALGADAFRELVEAEYAAMDRSAGDYAAEEMERIRAHFADPDFEAFDGDDAVFLKRMESDAAFRAFVETNAVLHKKPGYRGVTISLKPIGGVPGDASADQMRAVAAIARQYAFSEIRVSHEQNLILPHVATRDLPAVHDALEKHGLATANAGLVTDIIACPGLDYCALATARSIPIAQDISKRFADPERQRLIGEMKVKISGCINACGHHHVGHVGILGLEKRGEEYYQITLGGHAGADASIGDILGPGFAAEEVPGVLETIADTYLKHRRDGEIFIDAVRRLGPEPFKEALYG